MLDFVPVIAWCIEGPNIDDDRIIPVTEDTEIELDVYALQYPDGSFHFPDGEHVTGDDALLASFRRRCAWRNAPYPLLAGCRANSNRGLGRGL